VTLEPEKAPSQNSPEPRGLLYILLYAFGFLSALFLSKVRAPFQDSSNPTHPQDSTEKHSRVCHTGPIKVEIIASPEQITADGKKDRHEQKKFRVEKITAILVFAYAAIAIFQWSEMRKATRTSQRIIKDAEEHFRVDERAWVEIEPIRPTLLTTRTPKFGAMFKYDIYPKNVGKTAAHNITFKAQSSSSSIDLATHADWIRNIQDKELLDQFKEGGTDKPVIVPNNPVPKILAPGTVAPVPFPLTGQEPQIFPNGEWVSYLVGRVDYIDQFEISHWMKFCFFVANAKGELWSCKEGNEEDQNSEVPEGQTHP
jgi:hypothetical protein